MKDVLISFMFGVGVIYFMILTMPLRDAWDEWRKKRRKAKKGTT